ASSGPAWRGRARGVREPAAGLGVGAVAAGPARAASGPSEMVRVEAPIITVRGILERALAAARTAGVPEERIVLDPGIGFFRDAGVPWHLWDVAVLARLPALAGLGRPLCAGVSRRSFVGAITGREDPAARLPGSL